ncbi:MAG: hypothetical protein ACTJHW_03920 [Paenalcaligenes sp.]
MIAITSTEKLLTQANLICQSVTKRSDISYELLHAVFERLCMEQDMQEVLEPQNSSHDLH